MAKSREGWSSGDTGHGSGADRHPANDPVRVGDVIYGGTDGESVLSDGTTFVASESDHGPFCEGTC